MTDLTGLCWACEVEAKLENPKVAWLIAQVTPLVAGIRERDAEIARLRTVVAKCNTEITRLGMAISDRGNVIARLIATIDDLKGRL